MVIVVLVFCGCLDGIMGVCGDSGLVGGSGVFMVGGDCVGGWCGWVVVVDGVDVLFER